MEVITSARIETGIGYCESNKPYVETFDQIMFESINMSLVHIIVGIFGNC